MGMMEHFLSSILSDRVNKMSDDDKMNLVKSVIMDRVPILYAQDITKLQAHVAYVAIKEWFEQNSLEPGQTLVCKLRCKFTDLDSLYDETYRECTPNLYRMNDLELYQITDKLAASPKCVLGLLGQKSYEFDEYFITKEPERIVFISDANHNSYKVLIPRNKHEYAMDQIQNQVAQFDDFHCRANTEPLIAFYMGKAAQEGDIDYSPFYTDEMIKSSFVRAFEEKMTM